MFNLEVLLTGLMRWFSDHNNINDFNHAHKRIVVCGRIKNIVIRCKQQ